MHSIPACCSSSASVRPAGPAPTIPTRVGMLHGMYTSDPPYDFPDYRSTALRHPKQPLISVGPERSGPALGHLRPGEILNDLTKDGPVGERITVSGRLPGPDGPPLRDSVVEVWQANGAGRYRHRDDRWPAPLDP